MTQLVYHLTMSQFSLAINSGLISCHFKHLAISQGLFFPSGHGKWPGLTVSWAPAWQNQQNDLCTQRRFGSAWMSMQSDQSSLCTQWVAKDPRVLHVDREDSDQTGRIWVFAGCTGHWFCFVVLRLGCLSVTRFKRWNCLANIASKINVS